MQPLEHLEMKILDYGQKHMEFLLLLQEQQIFIAKGNTYIGLFQELYMHALAKIK